MFYLINKHHYSTIKIVRIQKEILPMVHSLCQDVNSDVRANICLQLRFVAEGLGAESAKPALLPSLVELASDEESNVRYASVQTIVYLLPHLQEGEFYKQYFKELFQILKNRLHSREKYSLTQ